MACVRTVKSYRGPRDPGRPLLRCGRCGRTIEKGDTYYWWANRAPGMRSGRKHFRCADHYPSLAERTPGRRGQLYGIQEVVGRETAAAETHEDLIVAAESAAGQLRDLAAELVDGADNIESGFGHEVPQSAELREKGKTLGVLADEVEGIVEDPPEPHEDDPDETDEEYDGALDDWLERQRDAITEKVEEAEV